MIRVWWILAIVGCVALVVVSSSQGWPWYTSVIACVALGLFVLLQVYEKVAVDSKYVALVATLSALASVSRAAMQGIPGVQPATFFVIISGYTLGPVTGAFVGAFTAVGSNLFLGEGGWTPWQMLAWGLVGCSAGLLRRLWPRLSVHWLIPFGLLSGYGFGWLMNTWALLSGPSVSWTAYLLLCISSVWFDTAHAVATAVFLAIAGKPVFRAVERYRLRMQVTNDR